MDLVDTYNDRKKRSKSTSLGNMIFGKVPPQSIKIEEAVLGSLMLDPTSVNIGIAKLFPEIFYRDANQRIFKAIQDLYDANSRIDMMTVVERLKKNESLELVGGPYAISKLTDNVTSSGNIENYIQIISEAYLKRASIELSGELLNDCYEESADAFDIIAKADSGFQAIQEKVLTGAEKDITYFGMKVLDQHATTKETGILGVTTGLKSIDDVICGLVAPDLLIVAARPGQGKTALILSITYNTSVKNKIPCAWFSLEMDGVQLVRRLVSIDTGISHERIRRAETSASEGVAINKSVEKISKCPIYIEDKSGLNVRYIRTRSHLLKRKYGIKFIVVDYLQLMKSVNSKETSRENIVSEISRSLKELAKELDIPVIALSQLSREVEKRPTKMPQLSDLRESGGIEQDADGVLFLMRPDYYDMTEPVEMGNNNYPANGLAICKVDKNRHGDTKSTPLYFNGPCMHFTDHQYYTGNMNQFGGNLKPVKNYYETEKDAPF